MHALISVSDKTGIVELASALHGLGIALLSTGGTARLLADAGLPVTEVAAHTGFPEMLDGRVKTLHPTIHGGLLARRDKADHMKALEAHGIAPIELLVVNLYPFEATVANSACTLDDAIENIDIGGPAMVRSAAKNWKDVAVLTDASQYVGVLEELKLHGAVTEATRFALAVAAFDRIANYDAAISDYLSSIDTRVDTRLDASGAAAGTGPALGAADATAADNPVVPTRLEFPTRLNARFVKVQDLRYGENPHQRAALYGDLDPAPGSLVTAVQLQGKELSYNNLADADAAWECVKTFRASGAIANGGAGHAADPSAGAAGNAEVDAAAACVIVKHANPCGVAIGADAAAAYAKAFKTDPTSAFGGIIAFNVEVDEAAAKLVAKQFVEVLLAPSYSEAALTVFAAKANTRVLRIPLHEATSASSAAMPASGSTAGAQPSDPARPPRLAHEFKRVGSGLLIQTADQHELAAADLKIVTKRQPTPDQLRDLMFAWKVAKFVKSNAIVFCAGGMTLGVGAGQMSRLDSARIASIKAEHAGLSLAGSAVASDAFFPFRDGLDVVIDAGATSVIQPGGSVRDDEVIAAADERGIAMVLTGVRHFRH